MSGELQATPSTWPVGRVGAIAVVLALGAAGLAFPGSVLRGGVAWLAFLLAAASGWGYLVVRVSRVSDPDFGLRATWGLAGYLGAAGGLVALGICTRPVLLVLLGLGVAGFAWRELTTPVASISRLRDAVHFVRRRPALGVLATVLVGLALVNLVGAVAHLDRNPWDDDLAYTPLIKRLLDVGDLIEPFSFRRLGSYGGQTALGALAGVRGTLANVHLVDRGLGQILVLLLAAGYARERGTHAIYVAVLAFVLLLLPETSINTAAAWTGVAMFLALYRTVTRGHWALVGVVGAATCTLRQNYLAVVVIFVGILLILRWLGSRSRSRERANWWLVIATAVAMILPWWIAAYRSSGTFLFPVIDGTWNHALSVKPAVMSWAEELTYVLWSAIDATPIVVMPVLFAVLCVVRDSRAGRPLQALFIGVVAGFLLLVHGFAGTEPFHLWRYAFGFSIALVIVMVVELGADRDPAGEEDVRSLPLARWVMLSALILQLLSSRGGLQKRFADWANDVREAAVIDRHGDPVAAAEAERYRLLQAAIPAGSKLAVMLDDPWLLDFRRNPIANLDTPGFASPGAQLPMFRGSDAMRAYLIGEGYRYVAFVRSDRSRYFFRRPFWIWRLYNDGELFALMSAYTIDMIEAMAQIASGGTVLYDRDGLVAIDLGANPPAVQPALLPEAQRRDAFLRELAEREGMHEAWSLTNRHDLRFEDGVANLVMVDGAIDDPAWFEVTHPAPQAAKKGTPTRALFRRAHLRVRGEATMQLFIRAAVALETVYTHPRLDLSLDGELIGSVVADASGRFTVDLTIPAEKLAGGWHDLYLISNSIAEPDARERDLRVTRLELVEWRPKP